MSKNEDNIIAAAIIEPALFCPKGRQPQFYNPGFKMLADTPVRLDGFYFFKKIMYDTMSSGSVKKADMNIWKGNLILYTSFLITGIFFGNL